MARWDVLDFIARLTQHIPDPSQQLVRYWGFYSNAARGKRRRAPDSGDTSQVAETTGSVRAEDRQGAVRLGRYMIRCPLVLDRLEWDAESGEVVYSARPRRTASPYGTVARWDVLDFIARLTQHIPDPSQQPGSLRLPLGWSRRRARWL